MHYGCEGCVSEMADLRSRLMPPLRRILLHGGRGDLRRNRIPLRIHPLRIRVEEPHRGSGQMPELRIESVEGAPAIMQMRDMRARMDSSFRIGIPCGLPVMQVEGLGRRPCRGCRCGFRDRTQRMDRRDVRVRIRMHVHRIGIGHRPVRGHTRGQVPDRCYRTLPMTSIPWIPTASAAWKHYLTVMCGFQISITRDTPFFQTIGCIRGEVWRFRINQLHRGGNPIDCSRRSAGMSKQVKEECE